MKPKILCFAGSLRNDSFNKKLVRAAAQVINDSGGEATFIDLKDYPLPIYDGDIESAEGLPENAIKLKKLFFEHQGLLIASPEYNSSISAALKNTIDWVSRPQSGEKQLACYDGKVAAILAASPGALGGLRGLVTLRSILGNIKVIVLPEQLAISKANEAFSDDGSLKDEKQAETVKAIAKRLVEVTGSLLESSVASR